MSMKEYFESEDWNDEQARKNVLPCPLCQSDQIQVCTDANNHSKDYAKCRHCKCQAPLTIWQRRSVEHETGEIEFLLENIKNADLNGLIFEFVEFFLSDYSREHNILSAVYYANREWDL